MVGQRRWFIYLSDSGQKFTVELDLDTGDAFGFDRVEVNQAPLPMLPRGTRMRVVNLRSRSTGQPRAFPVGKPTHASFNGSINEVGFNGQYWDITGVRGEKARRAHGRPA